MANDCVLPQVGTYITFGGIAGGIFFQEFELLHEATSLGYGGWALYVAGMVMCMPVLTTARPLLSPQVGALCGRNAHGLVWALPDLD